MNIKNLIQDSIQTKERLLENDSIIKNIELVTNKVAESFTNNGQVLFCGNGGSAADAQHLAAEFSGRFYFDRAPLNAEALHVNTSYLTAVGNDYSFDDIYSRIIKAKGKEGDILFGISTSGNSKNIINALIQAKKQGLFTIGLSGETGGKMKEHCDILINIPSTDTPRIQECHILVGHIICQLVEEQLFKKS